MRSEQTIDNTALLQLLNLIQNRIGLRFEESCWNGIARAAQQGMEQYQESYASYYARLVSSVEEWRRFVDLITITETYFFREEKQFHKLKKILEKSESSNLVCWSVTSATGEEPYSIAMLLAEYFAGEFKVYATDINQQALGHIRRGTYGKRSMRSDGSAFHYLLDKYGNHGENGWRPSSVIRDKVLAHRVNLNQDGLSFLSDKVDIVFFRNTLIYMEPAMQRNLLQKIGKKMKEGATLFLGSSEVPMLDLECFVLDADIDNGYSFVKQDQVEKQTASAEKSKNMSEQKKEVIETSVSVQKCDGCDTNRLCLDQAVLKLNRCKLLEAEINLRQYENRHGRSALVSYLAGQIAYHKGNRCKAESCFEEAIKKDVNFWPSYYRLGLLHSEKFPSNSLEAFVACRSILERPACEEVKQFSFLFGDFDPAYISNLCAGWEKKLRAIVG